jgi:hypothetical protein
MARAIIESGAVELQVQQFWEWEQLFEGKKAN